jgi:RNA polymerase sigma factor (sigma-70 family)
MIDRSIRRMGGKANLVGDCQGGWLATIYAALHPERVHTLTLAGAPIDFHAGDSVIAASTLAMAGKLGMAPYRALVASGGGNMPGRAVLANFIMIQPQSEISRQLQLLANVDDAAHVERYRVFEDWFKHTQDIPGAFYLWLVENLFWKNRLVSGELEIDGRKVDMGAITCPLFLLAGSTDHITPPAQLFAAADAENTVISHLLHDDLRRVLATLEDREQAVIRMRYGLDDGQPRTLDQIGRRFGLSRERVRQIEREVMAKLRIGERADRLRAYAS